MDFPLIARRFIRNYMFGKARMGRSTCKRLLLHFLPQQQQVELEPGFSMHLDLSKTNHQFLFWFHEEHESSLQWAIRALLPSKGTFVDCGANLGLMGLLAIHHRQAQVVFVEPHPRLAETIVQNLALNRMGSDAKVCQAAASNQDGFALLHIDLVSDGGHTLSSRGPNHNGPLPIQVKTMRLETLLRALSIHHVHFLKIDAEDFDFQALEGLGPLLSPANIELIYIEMGGNYRAIWELLSKAGYCPFAAEAIYIDRLRQLERRDDSSKFFSPVKEQGDGNLLWCGRGSAHEKFLRQTCRINI